MHWRAITNNKDRRYIQSILGPIDYISVIIISLTTKISFQWGASFKCNFTVIQVSHVCHKCERVSLEVSTNFYGISLEFRYGLIWRHFLAHWQYGDHCHCYIHHGDDQSLTIGSRIWLKNRPSEARAADNVLTSIACFSPPLLWNVFDNFFEN